MNEECATCGMAETMHDGPNRARLCTEETGAATYIYREQLEPLLADVRALRDREARVQAVLDDPAASPWDMRALVCRALDGDR